MAASERAAIKEALTFDDVLLLPGHSEVLPSGVDLRTRLTREITLSLPIISAAMDTVTEARLAIALAQAGGIGVIHRNIEPEAQAEEVRKVKRYESGMVVNPITIVPDETLADALALMRQHGISGIPVVEHAPPGKPARLVGILTNRDVRFADNPNQPVSELMTKKVITVREGVSQDEARRLLHQHRLEKLSSSMRTTAASASSPSRTSRRRRSIPTPARMREGRLRVAAASTVGDKGYERALALIDAGVGRHRRRYRAWPFAIACSIRCARIKRISNKVAIIAGNVATADGTKALIDAGADAVKVGIGPGSICTTRIVAGVGVPQLTAILDSVEVARERRHSRHRRRRHQIFRRSRQGDRRRRRMRDDRLAARRHRRKPRRGLSAARAARSNPIAAWARSARWRAARPTAISSRTSRTR